MKQSLSMLSLSIALTFAHSTYAGTAADSTSDEFNRVEAKISARKDMQEKKTHEMCAAWANMSDTEFEAELPTNDETTRAFALDLARMCQKRYPELYKLHLN